ncbi:Uncharacterised protein [Mycobacterium tuberculosis]|nr:Uncharacterised protein [Mycobacterium tuberculosis]
MQATVMAEIAALGPETSTLPAAVSLPTSATRRLPYWLRMIA